MAVNEEVKLVDGGGIEGVNINGVVSLRIMWWTGTAERSGNQ